MAESAQQYRQRISKIAQQGRAQVRTMLTDASIRTIGCVDHLTSDGDINIAGGAFMLYYEGQLEAFFANRRGGEGTLYVHLYCGYLFTEQGFETLREHEEAVSYLEREVQELNARYGCDFRVVVEDNGSARPHMH